MNWAAWATLAGLSLVIPNVILAVAEAARRKRCNPALALSAMAATCTIAVIAARIFATELAGASVAVGVAGVVLLVVTRFLNFSDAVPRQGDAPRPSFPFPAVAGAALLAFVAAVALGMLLGVADYEFDDGLGLLVVLIVALPVLFATYLAAGAQSHAGTRVANSLIWISAVTVWTIGTVSVTAAFGTRLLRFGQGAEIVTLTVGIFAMFVLLFPAGWLYASTIAPPLRAAAVAAWNALLIGGCAIGMRYGVALESPFPAIILTLVTIAWFQRERVAVRLRLTADVIRRWVAALRRVRAAAPTPAPAR
jgi:hypothetical protein